ncbi:uncharacterized protein AAES06_000377 [Glossophaga mutica]
MAWNDKEILISLKFCGGVQCGLIRRDLYLKALAFLEMEEFHRTILLLLAAVQSILFAGVHTTVHEECWMESLISPSTPMAFWTHRGCRFDFLSWFLATITPAGTKRGLILQCNLFHE